MESSLTRIILATIGGYILMLLAVSAYDWVKEEFPQRPAQQKSSKRFKHPRYRREAIRALKRFSRLSKTQKNAVKKNLSHNLFSMERWAKDLQQSGFQIVCMGEHHEESTRSFLAENFFSAVNTDALFLEATPDRLRSIITRMNKGRDYFPLLDADILDTLRAVKNRNPGVKVRGIEETKDQQKGGMIHASNSRDQFIAHNFWENYQKESRHVILFGAFHCSSESGWLYKNLWNQAPDRLKKGMLNVIVLGEHQKGSIEAFVYFIDEIGMKKKTFVIPDTDGLHPYIRELFQTLNRQILEKYCSLIVFRGTAGVR